MPDREKVIKGLECHKIGDDGLYSCGTCPYTILTADTCADALNDDAHALLKAQEPRVMTLDELQECVTYWVEDEMGHVVPETIMDISGKNIMTIPVVHLTNGHAPIITKTTDGYNTKRFTGWRCWTSRPTDEQREATKWE